MVLHATGTGENHGANCNLVAVVVTVMETDGFMALTADS